MALTPTPTTPLRNEPLVLGTSALGKATAPTPTTPATAPKLTIERLVLAPPRRVVTTPAISTPFPVDDYWTDYSMLAFGVEPVELVGAEQIALMLDGIDYDTVFLCGYGFAGNIQTPLVESETPDGLRVTVKFHKYRASKGRIRHLVLPMYDCSAAPLDQWYELGLQLGLTSLHMTNYMHYIGTVDVDLRLSAEEIVAGFGVYADFVREDSLKRALEKRFAGATTARVLWEAVGTADGRELPRPTPETTSCRGVRGALDLNIRRVPTAGELFPERSGVADQYLRVNLFFPP